MAGIMSGNAPSITIGGRQIYRDLSTMIHLHGRVSASGQFCTMRNAKTGGTSGYQVTAGKTLYIVGIRAISAVAGVMKGILGYADNDQGHDTTNAPTNPVYQSVSTSSFSWAINLVNGLTQEIPMHFGVPAAKYVMLSGITGDSIVDAYGFEQ